MTQPAETQPPKSQPTLRKTLTVFDGISILIGITIGAGIFTTPSIIAGYQSSFYSIILFWIGAGAFVFIGGLIYAELGTRLPNTGGEYVYLHRAFGPFFGFIFGWAQLFIIRTSPAAGLSLAAAFYIDKLFPLSALGETIVALAIIAVLGTLNYIGIKRASIYQNISTVIKAGGLFLLVVAGLIMLRGQESLLATTAPPTATLGPIGNVGALMMMVVFSYLGWDRVGYVAGEMKNPRRAIPLSMFIGITIIIALYVSTNLIYHDTLGMEGVRASRTVASDVATKLFGPVGFVFVTLLAIISTTGSTNGTTMAAPRVYYAMAKDGLFFRWFDYVHPDYHTPSRAIIAHCMWAAVILLVRQNFQDIVAGMTFAILIFYALTTVALFKLNREKVGEENCYRMPFYPVLPIVYLIGILTFIGIRGYFEWEKSLVDVAFIATGVPFALVWLRSKKA
ncbi:MAG: APC family permease [bacterium]